MSVTISTTNKPLNPRAQDFGKGYNRASLYSGKALDFDGVNDYVIVPDSNDLDGFTNFTLHAIVKADTFPNYCRIFDKNHTSAYNLAVNTSKKLYMYAKNTAFDFDYVVPTGEYVSIVVAFTGGSKVDLFINGQLEETITTSLASIDSNSFDLYIGRLYSVAGNHWDGQISNAKIFNTALTAAQVSDLYLNPEKIVPDGVANSALKLWLPMMEGAGTTAYDGSGNGNHGTISGATWVSGVGAPVAQTALVGWNKGTNLIPYSEEFDQWTKNNSTVSDNIESAPNGTTTADKWVINNGITFADIRQNISSSVGQNYLFFVFAKAGEFSKFQLDASDAQFSDVNVDFDLSTGSIVTSGGDNVTEGIIDKGNGWYLCYMVGEAIAGSGSFIIRNDGTQTGDGSKGMYLWGGGYVQASDIASYIPTIGNTTQTSPVLLPQGLTANKDITGVNAVSRNAYALNLDGASWAEVHDNASLDITSAITLESWFDNTNAYDSIRYLFDKSDNSTNGFELRLTSQNGVQIVFRSLSTISKVATIPTSGWVHVVATYDGANIKMYIDGSLQNTTASTGTITSNAYPLTIGGDVQNVNYSLNKPIALPRIYNRALSKYEVIQNFDANCRNFGLAPIRTTEYKAYNERMDSEGFTQESPACVLQAINELKKI